MKILPDVGIVQLVLLVTLSSRTTTLLAAALSVLPSRKGGFVDDLLCFIPGSFFSIEQSQRWYFSPLKRSIHMEKYACKRSGEATLRKNDNEEFHELHYVEGFGDRS
jgi:hypothetical protein